MGNTATKTKNKTNGNGSLNPSDEKPSQVIDGETGLPVLSPGRFGKEGRIINLSKLRDVRIEMARLYRMVDAEQMDSTEANKRVWHLRNIGDTITLAEQEQRIAELEETVTRALANGQRLLTSN